MACHEGKREVAHLQERVEWLLDIARWHAPALRLLQCRGRQRLLDMIGSGSWLSGDGAGAIWWSLMLRCGFWQLLASDG